jgi:hypothetical protein
VQADGKVIIGGQFTTVAGTARNRIARLNADGTLDSTFDPNANDDVRSTAVQADGKVIIGGFFTTVGGTARNNIARIDNGAATGSLSVPTLNKLKWLRGGTAPEATRVTFEYSANGGATYTLLGAGSRISGGWQITGVTIPGNAIVRARAFVSGGIYNSSGGIVEATATAPAAPAATVQDSWSLWYGYAIQYYQYYAAFGSWDYAYAFYYYYYGIGQQNFYNASGSPALGIYSYYAGLAQYYQYSLSSSGGTLGTYYAYLYYAYAYYYYFATLGDYNSANAWFNAYYGAALAL